MIYKLKKIIEKISIIGIIMNILCGIGFLCIILDTMYMYQKEIVNNLIYDIENASNIVLINTLYNECAFIFMTLSICLLTLISSVILIISYIRKNQDLYLVGLLLSIIAFIFICFAYFCNYEVISIFYYLIMLIMLTIGYIIDYNSINLKKIKLNCKN